VAFGVLLSGGHDDDEALLLLGRRWWLVRPEKHCSNLCAAAAVVRGALVDGPAVEVAR